MATVVSPSSFTSLLTADTESIKVPLASRVFLQPPLSLHDSSLTNNHLLLAHGASPSGKGTSPFRSIIIAARSAVSNEACYSARTEEITIGASGRAYPIYIGSGILDDTQAFKRHIKGRDVLIITDSKVSSLYIDKVVATISSMDVKINVAVIVLPEEQSLKTKENVFKVIDRAEGVKMDGTATFIGLGGGIINDLCGFSAAVYGGGVNYIQIPTTLVAQVDVAVPDETGIYHLLDKQSICSYYEPECVIVDPNSLKTLPGKELISGISEVIKFALVRDNAFLHWVKENMAQLLARDPTTAAHAIKRSCEIKAEVLSSIDSGFRNTLTLGQSFGRAIERSMEPGEWLHGEALAVGIVMAVDLSHRLQWIDDSVLIDAVVAMERAHLPTAPPAHISKGNLKKNMDLPVGSGGPQLALLKGAAGNCIFTAEYDQKALESMLTFFCLGDRV